MGTVSLWMQMSLDGRTEGPNGEFDWPIVDEEVHTYFNDELRGVDSFLYGRKVYEGMAAFWPAVDANPEMSPRHVEYARIWVPMPKLVFSNSLEHADYDTTVVGEPDLAAAVAELRERPDTRHVLFGGAETAATFQRLDLIDEYRLFVHPVILGGGPRLFADLEQRRNLRLVEARTFDEAVVHLRYERR